MASRTNVTKVPNEQTAVNGRESIVLLSKSVPNNIDFEEPSLEDVRRVKEALETDQLIELEESQINSQSGTKKTEPHAMSSKEHTLDEKQAAVTAAEKRQADK